MGTICKIGSKKGNFLVVFPFAVGLIFTVRHHVLKNSLDNVAKIKARKYLFVIGKVSY